MNTRKGLGLLLALFWSGSALWAEEVSLKTNPDDIKVQIQYTYQSTPQIPSDPHMRELWEKASAVHSRPKSKTLVCRGGNRSETIVWENGKTTENWVVGEISLTQPLNLRRGEFHAVSPSRYPGFKISDIFADLAWIKTAKYMGTKTEGGRTVAIFEKDVSDETKDTASPARTGRSSLKRLGIDSKNGLPLFYQDDEERREYTYDEVPQSFEVPENIKDLARRSAGGNVPSRDLPKSR